MKSILNHFFRPLVTAIALIFIVSCGGGGAGLGSNDEPILDTVPPVITLNGEAIISLALNQPYVELGATARDNVDGPVEVTITGTVDTSTAGQYTITYSARDTAKNRATALRTVIVTNGTQQSSATDKDVGKDMKPATIPVVTVWKTDNPGISAANQISISTKSARGYDIDWGDGNIDTGIRNGITHTYARAGIYRVTISGHFPRFVHELPDVTFNDVESQFIIDRYTSDAAKLVSIEQWGDTQWQSFENAFAGATNLRINALDSPDLTDVENMDYAFNAAFNMNADISHWDVRHVESMQGTFQNARSFNQDISSWNVASVTSMNAMFKDAHSFNQPLGAWNVSIVTDMTEMFMRAEAFDRDLGQWNISNVESMESMFRNISLSSQHYDSILLNWSNLNLKTDVLFDAGSSRFTDSASTSIVAMIDTYNWIIINGGRQP